MKYIQATPNEAGAYPPPQSTPAEGLIALTDEQAEAVVAAGGFVTITTGGEVTVTPNPESLAAWKESHPEPTTEPTTEPTDTDILNVLLGVNT